MRSAMRLIFGRDDGATFSKFFGKIGDNAKLIGGEIERRKIAALRRYGERPLRGI